MIKFCQNMIKDHNDFHPKEPIQFFNFEASGVPSEWPEMSALGPAEIEIDLDNGSCQIIGSIAVTTRDDPNLFKLDDICNRLGNALLPDQTIMVVDAGSGAPLRPMKIQTGTRISGTERTDKQPVRLVLFRAFIGGPSFPQSP